MGVIFEDHFIMNPENLEMHAYREYITGSIELEHEVAPELKAAL